MAFRCKFFTLEGVQHHDVRSANMACNNCVAAGRMRRNEHRGPNVEVLSFRRETSGSTGVSHSHVHPTSPGDDKQTEIHQGPPGQQSQGGNTVVGNLA